MNKFSLSVVFVVLVSCLVGCGGPEKLTEEEWNEKDRNRILKEENQNLKAEKLVFQQEVTKLKNEVYNEKTLSIDFRQQIATLKREVVLKDETIRNWELKDSSLVARAEVLATREGELIPKETAVTEGKEKMEKWGKDVAEAKIAYGKFIKEAEKNLMELQIMDVNLRQSQEAFALLKSQPNTPANRQRMANQATLVAKLQREYYIALEEAKNKLGVDLTRAKSMFP